MQSYVLELEKLKQNSCFRSIKNIEEKFSKYILVEGKKLLNLSSNDYLNISTNSDLKAEFIEKYKNDNEFIFSSASARLLSGSSRCYKKLEEKIASLYNKESALLFNSGYQCNLGVVSSLISKGDAIFSDKLNHASIVAGLKLSLGDHFRYKHNDIDNLEKLLKEKRNLYKNALIISESVFSMDGDIADIKKLIELKKKYNCILMLDVAHGFLTLGEGLLGLNETQSALGSSTGQINIDDVHDIDIITLTLGKALGSAGALCVSNETIINYLINKASSFIFSTSLPSINVMWSNFLLNEKFDFLINQKEKLNELSKKVRNLYPTISSSHIIPIIIGDSEKTKLKAQELRNKGFFVLPINPPTVPKGTSRIRLSLTSDIEFEEIKGIFER